MVSMGLPVVLLAFSVVVCTVYGSDGSPPSAGSFWALVAAIIRLRNGVDGNRESLNQSSAHILLHDPDFLYQTFYREEGDNKGRSSGFISGILARIMDILEVESQLDLIRLRADSADVGLATISNKDDTFPYGDKMAERRAAGSVRAEADSTSIQRSSREVREFGSDEEESTTKSDGVLVSSTEEEVLEEPETYVPYLGFIIYTFPVFSFSIPFGGQLKLFGYDLL